MTDEQLLILKNELDTDPRSLGYAGKNPSQIKIIINGSPEVVSQPIAGSKLWENLYNESRWVAMGAASSDATLTAEQRNAAQAIVDGGSQQTAQIDVSTDPFKSAVDFVVAASVLDAAQGAAVKALGDATVSRATAIDLPYVRTSDIRKAENL